MSMIWHMSLAMVFGFGALVAAAPVQADEPAAGSGTTLQPGTGAAAPGAPAPSTSMPGTGAPLVGLGGDGLALAPPGSAAAARNDGLAGSSGTSVDLSYIPPAERDSYLNSKDFADHLDTPTRRGHHQSALSQLGGVAEGMAINGAIGQGTGLLLGGQ